MDVGKKQLTNHPQRKGNKIKKRGNQRQERRICWKPCRSKGKARSAWRQPQQINLDTSLSRVNASAQSFLEQTQRPMPITSHLQASPIIESKNDPLPSHLATDQGLSGYKAKLAKKKEELKAANARFEILQNHLSFLREELQGCYREDSAGVFDEIRERLAGRRQL